MISLPAFHPLEARRPHAPRSTMSKEDEGKNARQRKELRLQRAIQRIDQEQYPAEEDNATDAPSLTASSTPQQNNIVAKSLDRLERRRASSLRRISTCITETDKRESARRILNQRRTKERNQAKYRCKEKSRPIEEQIASGWEDCAAQKSAWDTKETIEKQQERCEALVNNKKDLIQDFSLFRRLADDDHQSSLVEHTKMLDALKHCITNELQEMQQSLEEELETIEEVFVEDRMMLLESNKKEIDNLILEKSNLHLQQMQAYLARRDHSNAAIHAERDGAREEFAKLKANLENHIHELEQKLEIAKSSHAMNGNKLDYNLRILSERNEEAAAIIKKQKKRLVQSKANFNESRDRYWEAEKRANRQIATLSKDCKALDSRNNGQRTKSRRFEMNDKRKYQSLLDMHIEDLSLLADRIKRCEGEIACGLMGDGGYQPKPLRSVAEVLGDQDAENQLANLSKTIDEATHRGWIELESKLEAYKDILNQRSERNIATDRIAGDCHGLQRQLHVIAESDHTKELICPPTMILQATKIG